MEPPAFSAAAATVRAAPGASALLHVPVPAGTQPFHFEWSRAGASLDDRFTSSEDAGGVRLTVSAARTGDSGVYTLQATNAAGKDTARVRLEVAADEAPTGDDPPNFLRRLQDLTVKVGTRTRFLVEIVSSTECKVTWYRNERRLMEAERVSLARDGTFWCADIAAVSVDDTGRWTCTAENAGGRASCSAHLNVLVPKAYKRPEFVEELRALLTEQGTVSLECKVVGVPTPVLRWFKDSREIKAGDVFALTANAEDPTSLGTYTCEAVNCMGRAYSSSKVHVVGRGSREGSAKPISSGVALESPPIFTKELEDKFVRISEPLTLGCHVVVPPWPRSVIWYNKEGKVEPGDRYHVVEDGVGGYLLEVPSAEWPDEGEWKCVATSSGGRIGFSSCYVSMDVPKNYRKPRFMENLQAVLTEEGLVSFECKVVGFPTPVLSWFKDGQELKPGDVYQLTGTNSLGSYCCIARNCMGQASSSAELTVEDIQNQLNEEEKLQLFSKNQAPKFIQGLKSIEAKIDEPFRFTIKVAIPPEPSVQWYRDDQPVDDSPRCHLAKEERGVFYLDIQSLEFLDQAEWKCVAVNDFGHSVTSCFLKLIIPRHYKKPRFLENLQAILSDEGAVNLECKVIGVPQPVLKWYKDGEELKPGDIHRIISGQDGTCCLGTYTCEAQNCMGIAASSASLLGFDDSMKAKATKKKAEEQALQRNVSLSTIHEERSSQMYDTPVGDITLDDKAEISFSFDGKEVSVSLYETPDLTEEDALQIMEMYADQISENVTEHNVAELPPLRFVKETSTSGNLLMEAIIIDVSPEYFASPEDDLRTEADIEDISIADENGPPQLSLDQDIGEGYLEKTMELLSQSKADIVPKKLARKKSDSQKSADDFYSLSLDQTLSEEKKDDDTQILSESFASARSLDKPKSKSSKPSLEEGQESSDITKTIIVKEEAKKLSELEMPTAKSKRERRSSRSSRRSSSGSEKSFGKSKEEVNLEQVAIKRCMTEEEFKTKMMVVSSSLFKVINDVQFIERDIILKSELMTSAATASRSLEIINSLIKPLSEIHSIADAARESAIELKKVSSTLFSNLSQPLKNLQQSLTIIEKCIDVESDNKTLVKKTCVAFIETCGEDVKNLMNEISSVTEKDYLATDQKTLSEINSLVNEINNVIKFSVDTIRTRNLLTEASEIKASEANVEAKHLRDTQKAVFELKSPLKSLLHIVDTADEDEIADASKVKSSEVILNDMSASVQDLQAALEQIETLSVKESTTSLHKYNIDIIETVMDSVLKLRNSFEQLSVGTKMEEDKEVLNQALDSIKSNLSEISSHLTTIERNVGSFDILQSDNKLETLQKMAQILISLENNIPRLECMVDVKTYMDVFHKNLTRVLENVIESNEAPKYFTLMEICDAVNRINASITKIDADSALALASIINTMRIIQDTFIKNVFDSELNCTILTSISDVLISVQEALNHADEISVQLESEHIQDITTSIIETNKAKEVIEHIDQTIAVINTVKTVEMTQELKKNVAPVLESISPLLEELKQNIASVKPTCVQVDEHISEMSDLSAVVMSLATPLLELNQNLLVLNQVIVENLESFKENSEAMSTIAEPLHELFTTLQILQQEVISQYGENVTPYDVSIKIANAVQNLQSCIVMIHEQPGVEGVDEMSTLEDISGIKTTAETIPSDRLVLPATEETAIEISMELFSQEIVPTATAQALQILNEHITILQTPEILDALDTLSEVSDYSSLKSVALGLGELHTGIEEIIHPFVMENSCGIDNLINTSKLTVIAEPMQELHQSLAVLDTSNIPIYEHILEIPTEKIHSVLESISSFKDYLSKCIEALFPAMQTADTTIEISNKVEALREVCGNLKDVIEATKKFSSETSIKQEVLVLEETVDNLLNATDVRRGIQIHEIRAITEELYEKIMDVQEELIQYTPHAIERIAEEAKLIQAIDEIENNIAVLEQYDFVDLSRASEITSCATPTIAMEIESEPLIQMDDILQNAVNVIQFSSIETTSADLMILQDFFKTCQSEFTIIRLIITKPLSHKKIIRLIQEFTYLQNIIKDFKSKRSQLQLADDVGSYLNMFFIEADKNLKVVQDSILKIMNVQSEILFTSSLINLENTPEMLIECSKSKEAEKYKNVITMFMNVVQAAKPILKTVEVDITQELTGPSEVVTIHNTEPIDEKIEEFLKFTEEQLLMQSLDNELNDTLNKIITCLQKHQDYKHAIGTGKKLIILKCLSECVDILQAAVLRKETFVEKKVEDQALKAVISEMLEPLQALNSQLANIQEQVSSGIEENLISIDITSTESIIEAVSEIHKDIVQQIESIKPCINNEEISLIKEADKEIFAIQETLKSLESLPVLQELKEIARPIDEVEKSLHNIILAESLKAVVTEKLPKDKKTALKQYIHTYLEIIEMAEEINAVINEKKLQESAHLARKLCYKMSDLESDEVIPDLQVDDEKKQADLVVQLQNSLVGLHVQVLEHTQELLLEPSQNLLKRFENASEQIQSDLMTATGVKAAILVPSTSASEVVKTDSSQQISIEAPEEMIALLDVETGQKVEIEKIQKVVQAAIEIQDSEVIVEEKSESMPAILEKDMVLIVTEKVVKSIADDLQVTAEETVKTKDISISDDLKQCIKEFINEDLSGSINKLSAVIDIEELKQTVKVAKELSDNIEVTDNNMAEINSTLLYSNKVKQSQLTKQLKSAITALQEQIFENYQQLESIFDMSKLQKVADVTMSLHDNLAVALANNASEIGSVEQVTTLSIGVIEKSGDTTEKTLKSITAEKETELSAMNEFEVMVEHAVAHPTQENEAVIENHRQINIEQTSELKLEDVTESKTIATPVEELKVSVNPEVIKYETLKQSIDDFVCTDVIETVNSLTAVINVEKLKQTVSLAKELRENIAAIESSDHEQSSILLNIEKEKQGKLIRQLQTELLIVQEQIFDSYQLLETNDGSKLQEIADITFNLQTQLTTAVNLTTEVKEKSFDSDSTVVPSTSIEVPVTSEVIPTTLKDSEMAKREVSTPEQAKVTTMEIEPKDMAMSKETIIQENQEISILNEGIEEKTPMIEKSLVVEASEADLEEVTFETSGLRQHIEAFVSDDIIEAIEELSTVFDMADLKKTVIYAKELLENINIESHPDVLEDTQNVEDSFEEQQAKMKEKLNEALTILQTRVLYTTQEITPIVSSEKLDQISELITHLQKDLQNVTILKNESYLSECVTEKSKEESLKQLDILLQEVSDKIDLTSDERVPEENEALRDSLDEVQTVIIKLKRDFDGANDTLNETLEDLECSVRSVQLQINEDSPPEMLKEACATLQLLVNNMTDINETCVSESVPKNIELKHVIDKCSNETEQTVELLEIASNVDLKAHRKLVDIVSSLNKLKDTMKTLRSGFTGNTDTLIEKGTEIILSLDHIEEKVFSIEKEIDIVEALPANVRDNIITAVHAVYGSISNMRGTISSTQKQYLFENYGQPSENLLLSIKNLSTLSGACNVSDKAKCKKLSKSLRNVLNHFEDIKFYINLDKTARLPSDAAFTKSILEDLKSNIKLISSLDDLSTEIKMEVYKSLKYVEVHSQNIEVRSTLEVKEKIPIFKMIASQVLHVTDALKCVFDGKKVNKEMPICIEVMEQLKLDESIQEHISERVEPLNIFEIKLQTTEQVAVETFSVNPEEKVQQFEKVLSFLKAEEKLEEALKIKLDDVQIIGKFNEPCAQDSATPSTSKQAQKDLSELKKTRSKDQKMHNETEVFDQEKELTDSLVQKNFDSKIPEHDKLVMETKESHLKKDSEKINEKVASEMDEPLVVSQKTIQEGIKVSNIDTHEKLLLDAQPGTSKERDETLTPENQNEVLLIQENKIQEETESSRNARKEIESAIKYEELEMGMEKKTKTDRESEIHLPQEEMVTGNESNQEDTTLQKKDQKPKLREEETKNEKEEKSSIGEISMSFDSKKTDDEKVKTEIKQESTKSATKENDEGKIKTEKGPENLKNDSACMQEKDNLNKNLENKQDENINNLEQQKHIVQNQTEENKPQQNDKELLDTQILKNDKKQETPELETEGIEKDRHEKEKLEKEKHVTKMLATAQVEKENDKQESEKLETDSSAKEKSRTERLAKEELGSDNENKELLVKETEENEKLESELFSEDIIEEKEEEKEKQEERKLKKKKDDKKSLESKVEQERKETLEEKKEEEEKEKQKKNREEQLLLETVDQKKKQKLEAEKKEKEKERLEKERIEQEKKQKLEAEKIEKEKEEKEKLEKEKERLEKERIEQEKKQKLEAEKIEKEKKEKENLEKEKERLEKERIEQEEKQKSEAERIEKQKEKKEKLEKEKERLEKERIEQDEKQKSEAEKIEKEKEEKEKLEKEKEEKERLEIQRIEQEKKQKLEAEKIEKEKEEKEKLEKEEKERLEIERIEQEKKQKLEAEKIEKEKEEKEKLEKENKEQERLEKERIEQEKKQKLEAEKKEKEKEEKEKLEKEQEEKERLEKQKLEQKKKQKLEAEKIKKEKEEKEKLEKEIDEKERLEKERIEQEKKQKLEAEKIEKEKEEKEKLEKEKEEKERLEKERIEQEKKHKLEAAKIEKEKEEKEKLEKEKEEKERFEKEIYEQEKKQKLEAEKIEKEKEEKEKLEKEKEEKERLEKERIEQEKRQKLEAEKIEKEKKQKLEAEKIENEKKEKEKLEKEKEEKERLEKERIEQEKKQKLEAEKIEKEKEEKEKLEKQKEEKERLEKERIEQEKKQKLEAEKIENQKEEKEKLEKEEKERLEKERIEQDKKQKLKAEKIEKEKEEKVKLEKEKEEKKRLEKERIEQEKKQKLEAEKIEKEKEEKEKLEKEKEEKERLEKERIEQKKKQKLEAEKIENEKKEKEKLEKEIDEKERLEKEKKQKLEAEKIENEKKEKEKLEKEKEEKERFEKEIYEQEKKQKLEAEKIEKEKEEKEKLEKELEEKEHLEKQKIEQEKKQKLEAEKIEKEKEEKEKLEKEKEEKERFEKEIYEQEKKQKLEAEKKEKEKEEKEKLKKELEEKEHLEKQKIEQEKKQKLEAEKIEKEKEGKEKLEKQKEEKERLEKERIEQEKKQKLEAEKIEKEKEEKEKLKKELEEKEHLEKQKIEQEKKQKLEAEKIEKEKEGKEKLEKQKEEKERLEKERIEQEKKQKLEAEKIEKEKEEKEKLEKELEEKERLEKQKKKQKFKAEKIKKEKEEKEKLEKQKEEKERLEKQRIEQEKKQKLEAEKIEKEKEKKEKLEKQKEEKERLEKERIEQEKKQKLEAEKIEKEKEEKEKLEKERLEKERIEQEEKQKLEVEKIEKQKQDEEKLKKEKQEQEHLDKERIEKEKKTNIEAEKMAKEKEEKEKLEKERLEKEKVEQEKKEKLEAEKQKKEKKEKEDREKLEKERLEKERIEQGKKRKLEAEKIEKEEKEKLDREKEKTECLEKEKRVQEKKEKVEKDRLEKEKVELEKKETERLEKERVEEENKKKVEADKLEKEEKEKLDEGKERLEKEEIEKEKQEIEKLQKEKEMKKHLEIEKLQKENDSLGKKKAKRRNIEEEEAEKKEKATMDRPKQEKEMVHKEQVKKEKVEKYKHNKEKENKELEKKLFKEENHEQQVNKFESQSQEFKKANKDKGGEYEKEEKLNIETRKIDKSDIPESINKKKNIMDSEAEDRTEDISIAGGDKITQKRAECVGDYSDHLAQGHDWSHESKLVTEISKIKLIDENEVKASEMSTKLGYSRKLKSETKLGRDNEFKTDEAIRHIKEYQYEPTARPKHHDREKPTFIDHNHRDYTMEFARPSAYREKTVEVDNVSFEKNTGRGHYYKANSLIMEAQLRSSAPPRPASETSRGSESIERRLEVKQRSKALSEARSILSEKRTASRDIKRKPVFSTYLTDRTAVEGSRVKLTCSVLSSSDPKVTWYKNGVLLDNKLKYRTKLTDGLITLEVLNAVPSDSAEYSCTVENENGSVNTSANLKVYPSFEASPIPPTFTRSIRDTFHLAENELVLECRIRGQPLPTITWLKDDRPVCSDERYQAYYLADGVCRLAINHPTPEDSGKYTCKAENSVWSDQITHIVNFTGKESRLSPNLTTIERSRFNRQALESSRRPHFGNVLTDYKVTTGGTIGLQVEIRGAPTRVEWLREGRSVIETYSNAKTYVEQGLYTLALSDVTERESGMYTCRAWSSHGTVDMNAAITVVQPNEMEGKPAIIAGRPEKDVLISVGEDLNISFRAQGEPKPKVVLMKGIRDITNSQRVCKMTSDDYVKFTVKRSVISDAGTYCVLARNAYGCDRAFVTAVVRQRASSENLITDWTYPMDDSALSITERHYKSVPDRIPGEPTIVDGGANWVSLAWPKPDPRDAAPVLAYKVESWLAGKEGGARWTELGITPLNSFDAFNLKQGEEYHFRVTPRNRYGWGETVQTSTPVGVGLAGDRPEFVDILPGQLKVLIGESANLTCSVKGKPVPEVVWMKNGHEIEEEDGRVRTSFNGFKCSLSIEGINASDEARYSCEATNVHGRASTYARLAVVADRLLWEADVKLKRERSADAAGEYPPQFTMRLRDRRVQATFPVRLTCQVVGNPAPAVTWFKDGEDVLADGRHSKSQDEHFHTLEIAPTTLEDGGVYEAMARNTSGAISCHCSLVVDKGIRAYVAPEFCCGLEPLYRLNEGEELRISAVVEAYPTVGVTWYRDGVRLRPSRRAIMTLDRDGQIELALAFVTPRDAGVYTCTASNEVGRASTSGKLEVIAGDGTVSKKRTPPVVLSPDVPYSKEPMFIRKPRSSEAREGDTVIIQCEVVGDPKPDVYWLRDFLKPDYYRDATHFKRVGDGPEYRFEIPHAKLDYTGAYSVVARNVHGESKAIISLQILARDPSSTEEHNVRYGRVDVIPRFERDLTDLLCHDGDAIEFECHVSGNPEPDIRWFHYTELIRECPDFEWSLEDGTARLKIKQVTAEDEGTYLCEASNNLGKATSSACLVVYPPGEPNILSQRLRRPPALLSAASTPRSTPRSTPARSVSRTPGPDPRRLCSPSRQMPPKFYTYPFNKVVEEGDHVVFQCAVKGLPAPWATWDKDGVIITPSSRITIREKDEILRILEIEEVTIEDVGTYRVTLENDYGRVEASARLEVITQKGKFYAGVRSYSASPRKSLPYRRRMSSSRQD